MVLVREELVKQITEHFDQILEKPPPPPKKKKKKKKNPHKKKKPEKKPTKKQKQTKQNKKQTNKTTKNEKQTNKQKNPSTTSPPPKKKPQTKQKKQPNNPKPFEWKEAKMMILHRKGDMKEYKLQVCQSTFAYAQTVHTDITKLNGKALDENQPREQAGFRQGYSTVDQTINRLIEKKCNEFKRPLCTGCIDYEKALDSIEHEAIFKALRSIGLMKPTLLFQNISTQELLQEYVRIIKSQKKYRFQEA